MTTLTMDQAPVIPFLEWWRVCLLWIRTLRIRAHLALMQQQAKMDEDGVDAIDMSSTIASLDPEEMKRFKDVMLPLLNSAYTLARYLVRDAHVADDVVQEVYLRALRSFGQYRGGDAKSWLLMIVRNCCMTWLTKNARDKERTANDTELKDVSLLKDDRPATPEQHYDIQQRAQLIRELIQSLSEPLREVLILRELDELSYTQIANVLQIPVGTVMSRLARARTQLYSACQQCDLAS